MTASPEAAAPQGVCPGPWELLDLHPPAADLEQLVCAGLGRRPRQLPAWLLYDEAGSHLFEAICRQPEYGLTRTETALLQEWAPEMAAALGPGVLVEFGAGAGLKVDPLLRTPGPEAYVALDISADALHRAGTALRERHPQLPLLGICCDYSRLEALPPHPLLGRQRRLGFYPGSSLGNFEPEEAMALLQRFRQLLGPDGRLLIGIDQPKPVDRLEAAYNDAAGLSAAFALNLLQRLNRELGGNFDPAGFRYRARWQAGPSRIEMALVSCRPQVVELAGRRWRFDAGEPLITEYSYKYDGEAFGRLAAQAGWDVVRHWSDPSDDLSLHLLLPSPAGSGADSKDRQP